MRMTLVLGYTGFLNLPESLYCTLVFADSVESWTSCSDLFDFISIHIPFSLKAEETKLLRVLC